MKKSGLYMRMLLIVSALALVIVSAGGCGRNDGGYEFYGDSATFDSAKADIFYIVSTNVWAEYSPDSTEIYVAGLDSTLRSEYDREFRYVEKMFGESFNFIAPYYHQLTLNAFNLPEERLEVEYAKVYSEIREAFDCYLSHINQGRPFIIAGFSQGGMLALDLVKGLSKQEYSQMIACYMIGYRLSREDMENGNIIPANDSTSMGVTISFNSAMDRDALCDIVSHDAATCINPINWTTGSEKAAFSYKGDSAIVSVDSCGWYLKVEGLDKEKYFYPPLVSICPKGNLHHWDLLFYGDYLRRNAMLRAYGDNHQGIRESR